MVLVQVVVWPVLVMVEMPNGVIVVEDDSVMGLRGCCRPNMHKTALHGTYTSISLAPNHRAGHSR